MKSKTSSILFLIVVLLSICTHINIQSLKDKDRYIGCLEARWQEYRNEINCLEWKYERDKVTTDGKFDDRVCNKRRMTWEGYEYVRPYITSKEHDIQLQERINKQNKSEDI